MDELNPTTLEDLLRMEVDVQSCNGEMLKMSPEFRVAVQRKKDDRIHFMIHPANYDGDTLDFVVQGNELKHLVEEVF